MIVVSIYYETCVRASSQPSTPGAACLSDAAEATTEHVEKETEWIPCSTRRLRRKYGLDLSTLSAARGPVCAVAHRTDVRSKYPFMRSWWLICLCHTECPGWNQRRKSLQQRSSSWIRTHRTEPTRQLTSHEGRSQRRALSSSTLLLLRRPYLRYPRLPFTPKLARGSRSLFPGRKHLPQQAPCRNVMC